MVVDGDPCILAMLDVALRGMGFTSRSAKTAPEAIAASAAHHPDLALIDMDVDDWADLVRTLRDMTPSVRCFLVDAGTGTEGNLAELGVERCFCKPFTLQQLRDAFG